MSSHVPPAGPRKRRLAQAEPPPTNGASGSTPRQEAIDQIDRAWENALGSNGEDNAIPINLAVAQASALIYIGDEIRALREELRWAHDQDLPAPGAPEGGPLAELFRDTTRRPGGAA